MSTALIVAARQALTSALALRGGLAGVQVAYAWPGDTAQREVIFTDGGDGLIEIAALRAGRKTRNEDATFKVVVRVEVPGGDQSTADARALTLGKELEDYLADSPTALNGAVAGVIDTVVESYELRGGLGDQSRIAELTYTVRIRTRLT